MVMGYDDPFETLFAFQRALENRLSSDWLGTTTAAMGAYPPVNVFQQVGEVGRLKNREGKDMLTASDVRPSLMGNQIPKVGVCHQRV